MDGSTPPPDDAEAAHERRLQRLRKRERETEHISRSRSLPLARDSDGTGQRIVEVLVARVSGWEPDPVRRRQARRDPAGRGDG